MYSLGSFDFSKIEDHSPVKDISPGLHKQEEEKEADQIDSQTTTSESVHKFSNTISYAEYHINLQKHRIKDKAMIFGGWYNYENLTEVELFDTKLNRIEDIFPVARGMRSRPIQVI